ncbi:MAG: hypothetical protein LQ346_007294 [Caloplaca aetnensis]|nr:MAG: hypothetical protein LQ346_007294 [Caloplaca aetnensis]
MAPSRQLLVRDNSAFDGLTPTMTSLLIALVVLLITGFSLVAMFEKDMLPSRTSSGPPSPVPEIRITFPEEEDAAGKRKSGRVVVVRISDNGGVGLEPYHEDLLPPYGTGDAERFQSLELDRIGGLKEVQIETKGM